MALPGERTVQCVGARPLGDGAHAAGVFDARDLSLAFVLATATGARCESYGGAAAERTVIRTLDRRVAAGRPGIERRAVSVRDGSDRPRSWRTVCRRDQWIALDWTG